MSRQRWAGLAALLLPLALFSAGCTRAPVTTAETDALGPPSAFQQTVNALKAIQPHNSPYSFDTDVPRAAFDFDINRYFLVLKHLTMEPGYVLD